MGAEGRVVERKGLQAVDVAVIAVLLAVGAVLRMFTPPFFGITPNLIIGMYCLAILLLRPASDRFSASPWWPPPSARSPPSRSSPT